MRSPARILVVDDNPMNVEILQGRLAAQGYEIVTAADGEEALSAATAQQPDLILLDVNLPGVDGWAVLGELRAAAGEQTPVVVMTAGYDAQAQALETGAQGYLGKPFELDELLDAVGAHLGLPVRDAHEEVRQ